MTAKHALFKRDLWQNILKSNYVSNAKFVGQCWKKKFKIKRIK